MQHVLRRSVRFLTVFSLLSLVPSALFAQTIVDPNAEVVSKVKEVFSAMPEMVDVAKCESGFRQFRADGSLLYGGTAGKHLGIFQINEGLHSVEATRLGYDIRTIDGNIGYALYLRTKQGTAPWKGCLPGSAVESVLSAVSGSGFSGAITRTLRAGMRDAQVFKLQQLLNVAGVSVAETGPGSVGNETEYFGSLTRSAVQRFQCAKGIVCEGTEGTTGYGLVGPKTRAALNAESL